MPLLRAELALRRTVQQLAASEGAVMATTPTPTRTDTIGTSLAGYAETGTPTASERPTSGSHAAMTTPRFRLYSDDEIDAWTDPEWLIDGILPASSLSAIYGPPNIGKSVIALDLAMSIATGLPWLGREVRRGSTIYVGAEGNKSAFKARRRAWKQTKHITHPLPAALLLPEPVLLTKDEVDRLIASLPPSVALIVIDTLAVCLDGDENATKDMRATMVQARRIVRQTDAAVLLIHHTDKKG
jgi:predicted ATP-dependent serine protease